MSKGGFTRLALILLVAQVPSVHDGRRGAARCQEPPAAGGPVEDRGRHGSRLCRGDGRRPGYSLPSLTWIRRSCRRTKEWIRAGYVSCVQSAHPPGRR